MRVPSIMRTTFFYLFLQTHSELETSQKQNTSLQQQIQDLHLDNTKLQQQIGKYYTVRTTVLSSTWRIPSVQPF